MQLEVGSILEGKVTGITKFGAFIELPGGKTGMVHISEVASSYVKEISDYLSMGQMVKVKVIGITPEGKVSLSIKQVAPAPAAAERPNTPRPFRQGGPGAPGDRPARPPYQRQAAPRGLLRVRPAAGHHEREHVLRGHDEQVQAEERGQDV